MPRRVLRGLFVAIAVLTGLAAAALVGGWIWLRSDAGQRFVLERLRAPLRAQGVDLDSDRVSGTLFSSLQLDDVTLRLCAQRVAVHVQRVEVHYKLLTVLRGAPELSVAVHDPVVDLEGDDVTCPERAPGDVPSMPRRVVLHRVEIHRGEVRAGRGGLTAIELLGDGVLEHDRGAAPAITFHLAKASARLAPPSDGQLELSGDLTAERLDLDLEAKVSGEELAGAIALRAHLDGPPDALRLRGHLDSKLGDADLEGTIDAPGRRAELALSSDRVVIAPPGSDVEVTASAKLRVVAVAPEGRPPRLTLRGRGDYNRRGFDPSLAGAAMQKHAEKLPGGSWSGTAESTVERDGLTTRFHIDLASEGKRELEPGRVVLVGRLVIPRSGRPRLEARVAPAEEAR